MSDRNLIQGITENAAAHAVVYAELGLAGPAAEAGATAFAKAGQVGKALGEAAIKTLGFPGLEIDVNDEGFNREAPRKSESGLKDILHGIKHLFTNDESNEEKIRDHVKSKMTEKEKQQYEKEEDAMKDYTRKLIGWSALAMVPPPPMPEKPNSPMHKEVDKRVADTEKKIVAQLHKEMTPQDLTRLNDQWETYKKAYKESITIHNPAGTGEGFKPKPTPGHAINDYWDRLGEATDKYLAKDK